MTSERCSVFHGREEILSGITDYLQAPTGQPLVLGGVSGSGKTSIMARSVKMAYDIGQQKPVVVVRFLGTSPDSSNLWRLLRSICQQVSVCYSKDKDKIPDDNIEDLKIYFRELLKCATREKPLVILLDSLDQLSRENGARKLTWLPRQLPEYVHMIVSVYTEAVDLTTILHVMYGVDNFINVPVFSEGLSKVVIRSWLTMKNRTLTNDQFAIVEKVFKSCSLPLFVKLTFDQVIKWRSYTPLSDCQLANTVQDTIDMLFAQLEKKHGKIFVFRTLAYATASKSGISETELEDLLSLDDVVLTNIFQIHIPPLRRIPPLLLVRLRYDLKEYLVDKEVDGVRSFFWYHRQFLETAKKRYLSVPEFETEIHSLMADYYIGKWYGVKKPFKYTPEQMKRAGATSPDGAEDRKISAQPLIYAEESKGKKVLFNKRKLRKLPLHLFKAFRQSELRSICLFNYKWIQTKLHAMSVMDLLLDYTMCGEKNSILYKILKASQSTLKKFPNSLSMEISGRLLAKLQTKTDNDEMKLLEESLKASETDSKLVPYQPCFLIPKESQMYTIEHPRVPVDCRLIEVSRDSKRISMLSNSNEILIWDLESGEMETTVKLSTKNEESLNVMIKPEEKDLLIVGTSLQKMSNPVFVVDINSGTVEHSLQLEKSYPTMGFKDDLKFILTKKYLGVNVIKQAADIFDIDTGKLVHEFDGKPDHMKVIVNETLVILHPKQTNSYKIYSLDTFETMKEIQMNQSPKFLELSEDLKSGCVVFDKSAEIQIICLESGKSLGSSKKSVIADKDPGMKIQSVRIIDDQCLITTMKGFVLHNITTSKQKDFLIPNEVKPPNVKVLSFCGFLTRDGSTLIAGYENYFVVWDARSGKILRCMEASRGRFSKIILSPSGEFIINTGMKNNSVVTWNVASMKVRTNNFEPLCMKNSVRYLAMDQNGSIAVVRSSSSQEFAVVDVNLGVIRCHISEEYECMRPAVSSDGQYAVLREYSSEACLKVWDTSSGSLIQKISVSSLELKGYILGTKPQNMAMLIEDENSGEHFLKMCTLLNGEVNAQILLNRYNMMNIFYAKNDEYCIVGIEEQTYPGVKICARSYRVSDGSLVKEYENIHPQRVQLLTPESSHFVGQRIHTDPQGKQSWELVVVEIETGETTVIKGRAPETLLFFGAVGRYGVDRDRIIYDLKEKTRSFQFDTDGDYSQITEIRGAQQPKLTSDERFCVWINFGHNLLKMGDVSSQTLVSVCPIHSIPMNINVTPKNILVIGCEDGRIMMLQLLTDKKSDSRSVFKTIFNRSMKKTVQARDSLSVSLDSGMKKTKGKAFGSAKTSKTCTLF